MKKYITAFIFVLAFMKAGAQSQAGADVASRIAQRLKDSLSLTLVEQQAVYAANIKLHNEKMAVRQLFSQPDSLRRHLQLVENTRDSLYKKVISQERFLLYLSKKENIVSY